jgi:protein TonB
MSAEPVRNFLQTREVGRPHRRWPVLPVSIAAHAAAALAIFIIPLTAEVELPTPAPLSRAFHILPVKAPPKPPPPPIGGDRRPKVSAKQVAPFSAPPTIEPEPPAQPAGDVNAPAIDGGVPFGEIGGVNTGVPLPPPPPPPPPPTRVSGPVRVGQGVREPRKVVHVAPVYPAIARSAAVQGTVVLEAVINERGAVDNVRVLRSVALLDNAAIEAVRAWRYTPTLLNGVPVPVLLTITINFKLDR